MTCPKHPHVQQICPACQGSKGGKVLSPKKLAALKRISKLPRPGGRKTKQTAIHEETAKVSLRAS